MTMKITYEDYDKLVERFEHYDLDCDWWPTIDDLKTKWTGKSKNDFNFLIWILETAPEPVEDWEKESKKAINQILYTKLSFID